MRNDNVNVVFQYDKPLVRTQLATFILGEELQVNI